MILIRDVTKFSPELQEAFDEAAGEGLDPRAIKGEHIWVIFDDEIPVFVCGIAVHSLVGQPVFWMVPCKQFYKKTRKYIRATKFLLSMLRKVYPQFRVEIEQDNKINLRFVEAFGFKYSHTTGPYKVFEVK